MSIFDYPWEYRKEKPRSRSEAFFEAFVVLLTVLAIVGLMQLFLINGVEKEEMRETNQNQPSGQGVLPVHQNER